MPAERSERAHLRDVIPNPILSVPAAVARLPIRDSDALRWLESRGLIRDLCGRRVVSWREVVAAIESGDEPAAQPTAPRARRHRAPRLQPL